MKNKFSKIVVAMMVVVFITVILVLCSSQQPPSQQPEVCVLQGSSRYVGHPVAHSVAHEAPFPFNPKIRLLVLKHCPDDIADTDAHQALRAADMAASKGLTIEKIGNYHINKDGQTNRVV